MFGTNDLRRKDLLWNQFHYTVCMKIPTVWSVLYTYMQASETDRKASLWRVSLSCVAASTNCFFYR